MARRILGMGDVVSLIERAQEMQADEISKEEEERLRKAEFTLEDFLSQIKQVRKMGGLGGILKSLPGANKLGAAAGEVDEAALDRVEAIIFSMTTAERRKPQIINGSRRLRIATGAGVTVTEVNQLLKQFTEMKKMMKQFQNQPGKRRRFGGLGGLGGFGG
jgi:signal recognition particle subunit SRP54